MHQIKCLYQAETDSTNLQCIRTYIACRNRVCNALKYINEVQNRVCFTSKCISQAETKFIMHPKWTFQAETDSNMHQNVYIKYKQSLQCVKMYIARRNIFYNASKMYISSRVVYNASKCIHQAETESAVYQYVVTFTSWSSETTKKTESTLTVS